MLTPRDGSMRRDIFSAYAASASRVLSWVIVSALVYRRSHEAFAMLALVRGTIGLLNYVSLGILPAMIRELASVSPVPITVVPADLLPIGQSEKPATLSYVTPDTTREERRRPGVEADAVTQKIFSVGLAIAFLSGLVGIIAAAIASKLVTQIYKLPQGMSAFDLESVTLAWGGAVVVRWLSEPAGAVLQARGRIFADNVTVFIGEAGWVILAWVLLQYPVSQGETLPLVGMAFMLSAMILWVIRAAVVTTTEGLKASLSWDAAIARPLLSTGLLITLAQLADYLYSPTDYLLINHLLAPLDLTHYAPAVQIDSGLLLLVTGLGSVLLPKTALAHAAGNREVVRTYYLRGTLASAGILIAASLGIYFASPIIFKIWFGERMPGTVAILPLVLLNTVIGGSSAVGRAILIGIGKAKPFTISVLIAGVTNVICSYFFVRYCGWGLNGIILGTIVAVVFRCGIWMPWYVLRKLREDSNLPSNF